MCCRFLLLLGAAMEITTAAERDIEEISRIYARSWKAAYRGIVPQSYLDALREDHWVAPLRRWLRAGTFSALMACDGGRPVGAALYGPSRDEALPGWGELAALYLLPEYYGRGYGGALFQAAAHALTKQGYRQFYLWVLEGNLRARRFYEKQRFAANGDRTVIVLAGEALTDLRYISSIGAYSAEGK